MEFLLITEFCSGGPLIDVMRRQPLTVEQVAKVINAVTQAVLHMHDRNPPVEFLFLQNFHYRSWDKPGAYLENSLCGEPMFMLKILLTKI